MSHATALLESEPEEPGQHSFEARYGKAIVSRGIATIPAILVRWQARLNLIDEDLVTIVTILSFHASRKWPSVSIDSMATWRGLTWRRVDRSLKRIEARGYLIRTGRDNKHGRSYFFDLSPLIERLSHLATAEAEFARVRNEQSRVLAAPLSMLSADKQTNRGQSNRGRLTEDETTDNKKKRTVSRGH